MKKFLYVLFGVIFFVIGVIGVVIPIFPTSPFLLIGTVYLMKGSTKFSNWFKHTAFYQKHMKTYVEERRITQKQKLFIFYGSMLMIIITLLFASHSLEKIITTIFFSTIILYFVFNVKTIPASNN